MRDKLYMAYSSGEFLLPLGYFFSRSLEAEGLHLPDLHARASHLSYIALVSCVLKHATRHECSRMLSWPHCCTQSYNQTPPYGHPLNSDSSFLRTICFVLQKRKPLNIFSKFNPLNIDTPLIRTLSMRPPAPPLSESVFTGFNRIRLLIDWYFIYPEGQGDSLFRFKLYRVYSIKRRPWLYTRLHAADGSKVTDI